MWNDVVAGAAIGGGLGVVVAKTAEDICSAPACASRLAVAGGALGHLVDGVMGESAPVVPGQWIDDSMGNGALIGGRRYHREAGQRRDYIGTLYST